MFGFAAGQLRHAVDIQQRSTTQDASGQQSVVWTSALSGVTWAKIEPYQAREQLAAGVEHAEISHKITMRHRAIFDDPKNAAKYRIVYAGRNFNILGCINLEERNRCDELLCSEGMNNG